MPLRNKLGGKVRAHRTRSDLIGLQLNRHSVSPNKGKNMTDVEIIEVTGHVLFTLNNFKRARDLMAPGGDHRTGQLSDKVFDQGFFVSLASGISSKRSNEVQGILDMIEYLNEIVIWLTEQRNYRGGWISTQVSDVF